MNNAIYKGKNRTCPPDPRTIGDRCVWGGGSRGVRGAGGPAAGSCEAFLTLTFTHGCGRKGTMPRPNADDEISPPWSGRHDSRALAPRGPPRAGPRGGHGAGREGGGRAPPREGRAWRGRARRAPILGAGSPGLSPGRADCSAIAGPGGSAWRRGGSSPWRGGCSEGEVARWSVRWSELVSHTLEPAGLRSAPPSARPSPVGRVLAFQ